MTDLRQDLRYALRTMRRTPGFTAIAVLSLALGTGANTAIFSLIDALMLRSLPVERPEQLLELLEKYPAEPRGGYFSWRSYDHFRDNNHVFSGLLATSGPKTSAVRSDGSAKDTFNAEYVSTNFFSVLGLKPAIGRLLGPADDSVTAVLSWAAWKSRFNLDASIVGKRLFVQDLPVTVVGVAPRSFSGLQVGTMTDLWVARPPSSNVPLKLVGRLKPGVSIEQARAEMPLLFQFTIEERTAASKNPVLRQLKIEVEPAGAGLSLLRDRFAKPLLLLMVVVALLLAIACANVAGMLLARGASRAREMAVRVSLGAQRGRLIQQALTESLLLSSIGAAFGGLLAYFGADALVRLMLSGRPDPALPRALDIHIRPDLHMLFFTGAIALLTGVLFGLAPALSAFRSAPLSSLRESGRIGDSRSGRLFGKTLVVAQVALSMVLLSGAGLFIRHLANLRNLDLGFRRDHVLLVALDPAGSGLNRSQLSAAYQEFLPRVAAIPGVRSASISAVTPLSGAGASRLATVEGRYERPEDRRYLSLNWIAPKYFETLGIPLLAGRDFTFDDQARSRVAIVNRAMARYYFGDSDPLGRHITFDGETLPYEIVGVAGDANYYEIREAPPRTVYFNMFQEARVASQFILRTATDPTLIAPDVRRLTAAMLKTVSVKEIRTLDDQVNASIVPERVIAAFSACFGALGALLAAIGIYGLLAYTVARRINEIGIRMALGATRADVIRMVVRDAVAMVLGGLIIGAPVAFWGRRIAASWIEGLPLQSAMPIYFGGIGMIAIALLAAYFPAHRAACVDPIRALRYE